MRIELGVGHEMDHSRLAPLPPIHPSPIHHIVAIHHIVVGMVVAVEEAEVETGTVAVAVRFTMTGIDTELHFDPALKRGDSERGTTVNEIIDTSTPTCVRGILEMTGMLGTARHD